MELKNIYESRNIIEKVEPGSIAEELGIEIGDILVSINDVEVKDIIDYKYLLSDEDIVVRIQKEDEIWDFEIEKDVQEDLGIEFSNSLIDKAKRCSNNCMFCFIDQLPKNMRETLYFKDDDSRLSFLQGNFITLTNMKDEEVDRIIKYRLSPINVSVHTTNPKLRVRMLKNKRAGRIYEILEKFHEANLDINCQIVLVPGVNDGLELERTINDLARLSPSVRSVAVVPIGVTKYRDGLEKVNLFNKKTAGELIEKIEVKQKELLEKLGTRFIFLSDEFYAMAEKETLGYHDYEGFKQYENGVGMIRLFQTELENALKDISYQQYKEERTFLIPTGTLAYSFMDKMAKLVESKLPNVKINVVPIKNDFFGHTITVVGLLTARDVISQLSGKEGEIVLISESMLKADEDIFLDDITLEEFEQRLGKKVKKVEVDGYEFLKNILEEVK